jgi:hypothetical protein
VVEAPLVVGDLVNLVDGSRAVLDRPWFFLGCPLSSSVGFGRREASDQDCEVRSVARPSGYSWAPCPVVTDISERGKRSDTAPAGRLPAGRRGRRDARWGCWVVAEPP